MADARIGSRCDEMMVFGQVQLGGPLRIQVNLCPGPESHAEQANGEASPAQPVWQGEQEGVNPFRPEKIHHQERDQREERHHASDEHAAPAFTLDGLLIRRQPSARTAHFEHVIETHGK